MDRLSTNQEVIVIGGDNYFEVGSVVQYISPGKMDTKKSFGKFKLRSKMATLIRSQVLAVGDAVVANPDYSFSFSNQNKTIDELKIVGKVTKIFNNDSDNNVEVSWNGLIYHYNIRSIKHAPDNFKIGDSYETLDEVASPDTVKMSNELKSYSGIEVYDWAIVITEKLSSMSNHHYDTGDVVEVTSVEHDLLVVERLIDQEEQRLYLDDVLFINDLVVKNTNLSFNTVGKIASITKDGVVGILWDYVAPPKFQGEFYCRVHDIKPAPKGLRWGDQSSYPTEEHSTESRKDCTSILDFCDNDKKLYNHNYGEIIKENNMSRKADLRRMKEVDLPELEDQMAELKVQKEGLEDKIQRYTDYATPTDEKIGLLAKITGSKETAKAIIELKKQGIDVAVNAGATVEVEG